MIPERIGNYRVVGPLGQGATGVVYKAVNQDTNQPVAVKMVAPGRFASAARRQQFVEEARAATKLSHPQLRQLFEVGEDGDKLYLVMEYLEGSTLKNLLVGGPLQTQTALAWGAEIAEGLAAAHQEGVVHGELIPAKVFVTKDGSVKLLDPGLWRLAVPAGIDLSQEENLLAARLPAALVAGLAPEQVGGQEPGTRSDVFALGALVYQMVTGRHPFAEDSPVDTMYCVLRRTPKPVAQLGEEGLAALDTVLAGALAKQPGQRYPSGSEIAVALRAVAAGEELPPEALPPPAPEPEEVPVTGGLTSPLWWAIGALVVVLVLWFLYLGLTR